MHWVKNSAYCYNGLCVYARLVLTGDTYDEIHLQTGDIYQQGNVDGLQNAFCSCSVYGL